MQAAGPTALDRRASPSFAAGLAALFVAFATVLLACAPALAQATPAGTPAGTPPGTPPDTPYVVIDRASGRVLLENRPFDRWYPASLAKLMTLYVTLRSLQSGEVAPGSPVTVSRQAAGQPPSKMGFRPGTVLRVDTAMRILIVKSANDIAVALAESVAGSVPAFVERMNAEAARLGLADSRYANPNGLHSEGQYVSARDTAFLARRILIEFPQYADYFAVPAIRYGDAVDYSYNLLLERFSGTDGMKTGFVCASGYNFVASATRGGRQVIAVLFGAFSQTERAVEAARLLLQGFERDGGPAIDTHLRAGAPVEPASQRGRMCSEAAMKRRYDPGAGAAVIDSPLLEPRRIVPAPLAIDIGGVDAPPSEAFLAIALTPRGRLPVPEPRPDFSAVAASPGDGPPAPVAEEPRIVSGAVPVPTPRPLR